MSVPFLPVMTIHNAGDFTVKAGWLLPERKLSDYELVYFPSGGKTEFRRDGATHILDQPCFLIIRPNERHSILFDPEAPVRHLFVHFDCSPLAADTFSLRLIREGGPSVIVSNRDNLATTGIDFKRMLHMLHTWPHHGDVRTRLLLSQMLFELDDSSGDTWMPTDAPAGLPQVVVSALDYVEWHLAEPLSISDVARYVGCTHEHLTRSFVRYLGCAPKEMVLRKRIDRAAHLLITGTKSVKEVAHAVGFADQHYFSRAFAKIKGMSATAYRDKFTSPITQHLAPVASRDSLYPLNVYFAPFP
jgi:AraC-like DNA-binding protein